MALYMSNIWQCYPVILFDFMVKVQLTTFEHWLKVSICFRFSVSESENLESLQYTYNSAIDLKFGRDPNYTESELIAYVGAE